MVKRTGCAAGLNPAGTGNGMWIETDRHPPFWKMKRAWARLGLESQRHPDGCGDRALRLPPILERKPSEARDRPETASYPQGYLWRQHYAPPTSGRPQGGGWSPKPALHGSSPWRPARLLRCGLSVSQLRSERSPRRFDSCRLIQINRTRAVGCRYPRWVLTPKHAGSTPASCSIRSSGPRMGAYRTARRLAGRAGRFALSFASSRCSRSRCWIAAFASAVARFAS